MQLGARWRRGDTPHRSVPDALRSLIAQVELAHPSADSWTLTWLEGRPRAALDHVAVVTIGPDGDAVLEPQPAAEDADDADDDWLT